MKTKQFYFGMLIALVAMAFSACSSSDELIAEKGKALSLDASILQAQPMEISTRGISISSDTVFAGVMHYKEVEMSTSEISRAPLDDTPTWIGGEAITVKVDGKYFQYTIGSDGSSSTMTSASPYYFTTTSSLTANAWFPSSGAKPLSSFRSIRWQRYRRISACPCPRGPGLLTDKRLIR